jgi:hypothetical protein
MPLVEAASPSARDLWHRWQFLSPNNERAGTNGLPERRYARAHSRASLRVTRTVCLIDHPG